MANPKITLTGKIGQDPESFASGKGLRLRVATNDRVKNDSGNWENGKASWWTVKLWGNQAQYASGLLKKGQEITVVGTITEETWVDQKTNANRSTYEVTADNVSVSTWSLNNDKSSGSKFSDDIWEQSGRTEVAPF